MAIAIEVCRLERLSGGSLNDGASGQGTPAAKQSARIQPWREPVAPCTGFEFSFHRILLFGLLVERGLSRGYSPCTGARTTASRSSWFWGRRDAGSVVEVSLP